MRKILSVLTAGALMAGLSIATAPPAAADSYCFGAPSEPLTYVCIIVTDGSLGEITYATRTVTIPSLCYGVGCTAETSVPVTYPVLSSTPSPGSVQVTWAGGDAVAGYLERIFEQFYPLCLSKPPVCVIG